MVDSLEHPITWPELGECEWNNLIRLESYSPSPGNFAGKQRTGANRNIILADSRPHHTEKAARPRSKSPQPDPLPEGLKSIQFTTDSSNIEIIQCRRKHLGRLTEIPQIARPPVIRMVQIDAFVDPTGRRGNRCVIDGLSCGGFNRGSAVWPSQFVYGSPIIVALSHEFAFHRADKLAPIPGL